MDIYCSPREGEVYIHPQYVLVWLVSSEESSLRQHGACRRSCEGRVHCLEGNERRAEALHELEAMRVRRESHV